MNLKFIWKNVHLIIIFIVAMTLIICGSIYHINSKNYNKNAIITTAKIYQISSHNNINTLYVRYRINNKLYKSIINTKNKNINMGKKIKIYCDRNNLNNITDGSISKYGIYIIIIGIFILIIDSLTIYKKVITIKCNDKV